MTALEIAQELVRRPSVNPMHDPASAGEAEVVDWLENWGHAQQLETRRDTVLSLIHI